MRWEDHLLDLFEDLEQQAEGLHLVDRDAEVADRRQGEYAQVDLVARLQASLGADLRLHVAGVGILDGSLVRVGADWCLACVGEREWVVRLAAVEQVQGLSPRAVPEAVRPATSRLSLRSALRGLAEAGEPALFHQLSGQQSRARVLRVGADFVEALPENAGRFPVVLPFARLAAVRGG